MIKDLMVHTMKSQGKYIRNVLCEHFEYSRQELYDLVKIHELKTFDDVLDTLGRGMVVNCANRPFLPFLPVCGMK